MRTDSKGARVLRGDLTTGLFATLFEPDVLMPGQFMARITSDKLPAEARLYRGMVDYALRDLTLPLDTPIRLQTIAWIRDRDGQATHYDVPFTTAIESGYTGAIDPEWLAATLLKNFEHTPMPRHTYVEGRSSGKHQGSRGRVTR